MNFDNMRQELLKEGYMVKNKEKFNKSYTKRFFYLVESVILELIESEDCFFWSIYVKSRKINKT